MIIELNNTTHPTVTVTAIDLIKKTVDFINRDGLCTAPFESAGDIPTADELKTGIESVLGEIDD
jgi:hypothetical protein